MVKESIIFREPISKAGRPKEMVEQRPFLSWMEFMMVAAKFLA
jgi:hypothetical protein